MERDGEEWRGAQEKETLHSMRASSSTAVNKHESDFSCVSFLHRWWFPLVAEEKKEALAGSAAGQCSSLPLFLAFITPRQHAFSHRTLTTQRAQRTGSRPQPFCFLCSLMLHFAEPMLTERKKEKSYTQKRKRLARDDLCSKRALVRVCTRIRTCVPPC